MPEPKGVLLDPQLARDVVAMVKSWKRREFPVRQGQSHAHAREPRTALVKILGPRNASNGYYPGLLVHREVTSTTTSTTTPAGTTTSTTTPCRYTPWKIGEDGEPDDTQDCWFSSVADVTETYIYSGLVVGEHTDLMPIVLVSDRCGTTTSTTTGGACSGQCTWTKNVVSGCWEQTASTCTGGCVCAQPQQQPPASGCATLTTSCTRNPQSGLPCGTTTTTTSTTPPGCGSGCKLVHIPGIGWVFEYNNCASGVCECVYSLPAPSTVVCTDVLGSCKAPPPPSCNGSCYWISTGSEWVRDPSRGGCTAVGVLPGPCLCDPPTITEGPCGASGPVTPCYVPGCSTCTSTTTNTTTPGCGGRCRRRWNTTLSVWEFVDSNCASRCGCGYPSYNGGSACDIVEMPCTEPTTTTSTTTSTSTTTPGNFYCTRPPGSAPSTPCSCDRWFPAPDPFSAETFGGPYSSAAQCVAQCNCPPTTTTTTTTSTTTVWYCVKYCGLAGGACTPCHCVDTNTLFYGGFNPYYQTCPGGFGGAYATQGECNTECSTGTTSTTTSTSIPAP